MNEDVIKDFKNYLELERGYSENTSINYISDISDLVDFINEHKFVPDLLHFEKKKHAENFVGYLKGKDLTSKSIARKISSLRAFYKYLLENNLVKTNPFIDVATMPE